MSRYGSIKGEFPAVEERVRNERNQYAAGSFTFRTDHERKQPGDARVIALGTAKTTVLNLLPPTPCPDQHRRRHYGWIGSSASTIR